MKFDPELAKKALAESTFGGAEKLNALGLKLTYGDTPRNRMRYEWLAANYKEVLGVDIALDPVDTTTFTALTKDPATFPRLRPPGLVRGLPGSAELAERLLEVRHDLRAAPGLQERRVRQAD